MYTIFIRNMTDLVSEEICIYNDESVIEAYKVTELKLQLEETTAGSLTMKVPVTNVGYDAFETFSTVLTIRKRGEIKWVGRLIDAKVDFYNTKELIFEGLYNLLMDTIQLPYTATTSISLWITHLIEEHNRIVQEAGQNWKTILISHIDTAINPATNTALYTDYETTLDTINNVLEGWSVHPRFGYVEVDRYNKTSDGTQVLLGRTYRLLTIAFETGYDDSTPLPQIVFGQNLMDYAREIKNDDVATVVIPRGAKYTDEEWAAAVEAGNEPSTVPDELDKYRTIYSVNSHDLRLFDTQEKLDRFGYISKTLTFDSLKDYVDIKAAGLKYLQNQQWNKATLSISAFDLKLMNVNAEEIKIGRMVHCLSAPHNLDYNYPCIKIEEDLLDVNNTKYTLGYSDEKYLSDASRKVDKKLEEVVTATVQRERLIQSNIYDHTDTQIERVDETISGMYTELNEKIDAISFDPSEAVEEAKTNALQLLNIYDEEKNPEKKGYVHFVKETADYSSEGQLTLSELKARINKYDANHASTQTFLNNLENWLANPVNSSGWSFVICVALGEEDYQTDVAVYECTTSYNRSDNHMPYLLNTSPYKIFTSYNGNALTWVAKYHRYRSTGNPSVNPSASNSISRSTAANDDGSELWDSNSQILVPNEFYFNNPALKFYCSLDIYESSSSNNVKYPATFKVDPPSDLLSLAQLKQKIIQKVPSSNNLTTFLNRMDEMMALSETEKGFISVIVKTENGVENWDRFKVSLIRNYYRDSTSYTQFGFGFGTGNYLSSLYSSNGSTSYVPYYGLVEVVDSESRVSISSSDYASGNAYDHTSLIDSIGSYSVVIPSLADILSTGIKSYVSVPLYKYTSLSNLRGETAITTNLVSHISNPQDHITEIVISDKADYMANDANLWRWNKEGLYYLNGGYNGATLPNGEYGSNTDNLRLAFTKDGQIVADRITAGQLDAGIIKTGVIVGNPSLSDPSVADFKMNINDGTIVAKKGQFVFANVRENAGTAADPDQALNEFAYFSNQTIGRLTAVAGKTSDDWMLIIGSSFGVDKHGRTYMREGHIGGVGGAFDVIASNERPIQAVSVSAQGAQYMWNYKVDINTDAYRPVYQGTETTTFRFRLGHYENNQIVCDTELYSFSFDEGTEAKTILFYFYTDDNVTPPFYQGELFPVWYVKDDNGEYVQDEVHYAQKTGVDSNYKVEQNGWADNEHTLPRWTSYTDERYSVGSIDQSGTINIGAGYLSNGTFGNAASFYLGGVNHAGSIGGSGPKSDFRFTVGSNFGITSNGNFYSNDGYLKNAHVEGTVTTTGLNVGYVGSLQVSSHLHDRVVGSDIVLRWRIFKDDLNGHTMFTSSTRMSITVTSENRANLPTNPVIEFQPAEGYSVGNPPFYEVHQRDAFRLTYDRNGSDRQDFFIDTSTWDDVEVGEYATGYIYITVTLNNQSQTFVLSSQAQLKERYDDDVPGEGQMYYCVGDISFTRYDSVQGQSCIRAGTPLCGSSLGANYDADFWNHAYIKNIHSTVTESGSSSRMYKHSIEGLDVRYDKLFDILHPVRFQFNKEHYDDGEQYHVGFVLEELKEQMDIAGIKPEEFGAYDPNPDGKGGGIRYSEFIPIIIEQLQKLKRENEDLRRQLYEKGIIDD